MRTRNLVHKHAVTYNKSTVYKDKKKAMKKGESKHKGSPFPCTKYVCEYFRGSDGPVSQRPYV